VHLGNETIDLGRSRRLKNGGPGVKWGCYDADRAAKVANPQNKYQHFYTYFNDIADVSDAGELSPKKAGEAVVLATWHDGCKSLFPLTVRAPGVQKFRVGTYNIRFTTGDIGTENAWERRRGDLVQLVRRLDLDVFGTQEVRPEQADYLRKNLPDYAFVGAHRAADRISDEASPVFYRKSRFDVEKSGTFWLCETPDVAGVVGWGAMCPRVCSYLVLREKASGKKFCFANTHTDHASAEAREKGMLLIIERMKEFGGGAPIIFTGDHNCPETEAPGRSVADVQRLEASGRGDLHARRFPAEARPAQRQEVRTENRLHLRVAGRARALLRHHPRDAFRHASVSKRPLPDCRHDRIVKG